MRVDMDWLPVLAALAEDTKWYPSTSTIQFTSTCNYSFGEFDALSWPLCASAHICTWACASYTHKHTCTHTHTSEISLFKANPKPHLSVGYGVCCVESACYSAAQQLETWRDRIDGAVQSTNNIGTQLVFVS